MSQVREQLMADLKRAMQSGDADRRNTLRLLLAAIKQEEVDSGRSLDDEGIVSVLMKQARQRRESIDQYEQGGRADLAEGEKKELAVIEGYLPRFMSAEELRQLATTVIAETGVQDVRGMGQVMGRLMPLVKGQADGRLVNQVVRELLSGR